jgi:hypothetical protein
MNSKKKNLIKACIGMTILWVYLANNKPAAMRTSSFETIKTSALQIPISDGLKTKIFTTRDKQLKASQFN